MNNILGPGYGLDISGNGWQSGDPGAAAPPYAAQQASLNDYLSHTISLMPPKPIRLGLGGALAASLFSLVDKSHQAGPSFLQALLGGYDQSNQDARERYVGRRTNSMNAEQKEKDRKQGKGLKRMFPASSTLIDCVFKDAYGEEMGN